MSNYKIKGFIEIPKGPSARVKVISFRRQGGHVNDSAEIRKTFPPEGFVFAKNIIRDGFEENCLVELVANNLVKPTNSEDDEYTMDKMSHPNRTGYEVFCLPNDFDLSNNHLELEALDEYVKTVDLTFYVQIADNIYGPIQKASGSFVQIREVSQIPLNTVEVYNSGDRKFLVVKASADVKFDCMTRAQLGDWFKEQVRVMQSGIDPVALSNAMEKQERSGLDKFRLRRAIGILDQLGLNLETLRGLKSLSSNLSDLYERALMDAKKEMFEPLSVEAENLKRDIDSLKKLREDQALLAESENALLTDLRGEIAYMQLEKQRLISDIRIQAQIKDQSRTNENFNKFEIQTFTAVGEKYQSLQDFIKIFNQSIKEEFGTQLNFGTRSLFQLKDYVCLLSAQVEPVLQIARLSNNCKIILQQVEPDWLKFEALLNNGLKQAWTSAEQQPETIHFLILQDINMSAIECFGKPLLDVIAGIRKTIPGLNNQYPPNLWIFGIPLLLPEDQQFGLPMFRKTYKHWGAFPKIEEEWAFDTDFIKQVLPLATLKEHDNLPTIFLDDYTVN